MSKLQAIRGMNDLLPQDSDAWQAIEATLASVVKRYGYREIRFPIVEKTALFKRSIGDITDIVEKEMYTFDDRNGDSLSLRPEGTAACVRAGIEHGLFYNQTQKLWYQGPFYRHERPQKGRYRQFHQLGVEAFGVSSPDMDAEIIALSKAILDAFDLGEAVSLQLNTMGNIQARNAYKEVLVSYFKQHLDQLDPDSLRRLDTNPLRILDSKNPALSALIANAPHLLDHLDAPSAHHFNTLKHYLDQLGIRYTINPSIVRGLDYYNGTVFEWVTDQLGASNTVCAGGRYDHLVEQIGGKATPAIGFALGIERLLLLIEQQQTPLASTQTPDMFVIVAGEQAQQQALPMVQQLRQAFPTQIITVNCGGGSLKSQFKKADKSGAYVAIVLGDNEINSQQYTLKYLRKEAEQVSGDLNKLQQLLTPHLEPKFGS